MVKMPSHRKRIAPAQDARSEALQHWTPRMWPPSRHPKFSVLDEPARHWLTHRLQHEHDAARKQIPAHAGRLLVPHLETTLARFHSTLTMWLRVQATPQICRNCARFH